MKRKTRNIILAIVCLIALSASFFVDPSLSKFVLERAEELLLNTVITAPPLTVTFMNGTDTVDTITVGYGETVSIDQGNSRGATNSDDTAEFGGWMNAAGNFPTSITVTRNVVLNAKWTIPDKYHVYFIDLNGNLVLQKDFLSTNKTIEITDSDVTALSTNATEVGNQLTNEIGGAMTVVATWQNYATAGTYTMSAEEDITINQNLSFGEGANNASIQLEPIEDGSGNIIDENGDGLPDKYRVVGALQDDSNINISIPESILGGSIVEIADNTFAGFDGLHAVRIPATITSIGTDAFSDKSLGLFQSGETITIYFDGSREEWNNIVNNSTDGWDDGLGTGSRIFFLNGGDKVDSSQGYIQRTSSWGRYSWQEYTTLDSDFNNEYQSDCNCDVTGCPRTPRPDAIYWPAE